MPAVPDHDLVKRIGRGSYGDVWLARNVMGTYRAAKVVYCDRFEDPRPFEREFAGLQRFEPISRTHPGFVGILHVGRNEAAGCFYSVMELADDVSSGARVVPSRYSPRTLSSELTVRGRLPLDEGLQIGMALTAALAHLHEHGLVHRDIKPSNIVFVGGMPRLADIGLVAGIGEPGTAVGTDGYIPPEGPGTPASDLYSLGLVLYRIVTGKPLHAFPDLPTGLREFDDRARLLQVNEIILRATERDPRCRYPTAEDLRRALGLCLRSAEEPAASSRRPGLAVEPRKNRPATSSLGGERKQVTALSLDVSWNQKSDPEDARSLLQRAGELVEKEVERCGGMVIEVLNSGMAAIFGAPTAHEDHARRAVHAALAIQRALAGAREMLAGESGIAFEVRCGVDTGLAVVAEPAAGAPTRSITGEAIQGAGRLAQVAAPGQVLVAEETWKAVRDQFVTRALSELHLVGRSQGQGVYEIAGAAAPRSGLEGATGKRLSPFVGRARELSLLRERFAEAKSGRGQVVLVAGEPGLGKSRLFLEFRRSLADEDLTWLTGRSVSFGREMALRPVIEMVRGFLGLEAEDDSAVVAAKLAALANGLLGEQLWAKPLVASLLGAATEHDSVARMEARHRKMKTFEAVRALLWEAARRRPLVLAIEDLHWIDQASEEFLAYLADSLPLARVLLVATCRPGCHLGLPERSYLSRITLARLSEADTLQIAQNMIGSAAVSPDVQMLISSRAEGNPFFVEELMKSLLEVGALRIEQGRCVLVRDGSGLQVPGTVQNVLMGRIDRLPDAAKRALQLASVIGREFSLPLLEAISDLRSPLPESLQQLKDAELIYERALLPDAPYVFKHALTQEVAYNSLLIRRRKDLHRLVAASIEELHSDRLPEFYGTLAYHYQLGEEWQRALDYLIAAAAGSQRIGGYREQATLLTQAIAIAERLGKQDRIPELRARRGWAYARTGSWTEARPDLERALADMPPERVEDRAEVVLELAGVSFWTLDIPGMNHYAKLGQTLAERVGRDDLVAGLMGWMAAADQSDGDLASAVARFDRALARGGGFRCSSLANYPLALYLSGRVDEAIQRGRESVQMCSSLADNLAATFGGPHLGLALAAAGRYDEAIRVFDQALELGAKHEIWPFHARAMAMSAGLHLDVFDFPAHEALAEEARERGRMVGWQPPVVSAGLDLVFNAARRGQVASAEKFLSESSEAILTTGGWHRWLWELRLAQARAEVALARENWPVALRCADESIAQSGSRGRVKYQAGGLTVRARALANLGRQREAIQDLRRALKLVRSMGDPAMFLRVCAPLLQLDGDEALETEARAAVHRIHGALSSDRMRRNFLTGAAAHLGHVASVEV